MGTVAQETDRRYQQGSTARIDTKSTELKWHIHSSNLDKFQNNPKNCRNMIESVPISSISLLKQYTMSSLSAVAKRVRSLSETSEKLEKEEEENLDLDLDEKLGQRRDTLASIDSGIGEELTDEVESDGEDLRTDPETGLRLISLDEVRDHCTMEDGWMVLYDRVYQVSNLLRIHPGG